MKSIANYYAGIRYDFHWKWKLKILVLIDWSADLAIEYMFPWGKFGADIRDEA
jgi:hypothetical protein